MGRVIDDYDSFSQDRYVTEDSFRAGADLKEGISGKAKCDSTFENTEEFNVNEPRSDKRAKVFGVAAPGDYLDDVSETTQFNKT